MTNQAFMLVDSSVVLPGPNGTCCFEISDAIDCLDNGVSCLSPLMTRSGLPGTVVGKIDIDPAKALGLNYSHTKYYSRAALLGAVAVQKLLTKLHGFVQLVPEPRTMIILASLQFSASDVYELIKRALQDSIASIGMDYWTYGTPASVASGICNILRLNFPTLNIAGSCNVGLRALEIGLDALNCGRCDRIIVVGVDSCIDDIFLSSSLHLSGKGYRASVNCTDVTAVRPHDCEPLGNSSAEGAIAIAIERFQTTTIGVPFTFNSITLRSSGRTTVASGPVRPLAETASQLLRSERLSLDNLAFLVDYTDGNQFVEQHFCDFLSTLRDLECANDTKIRLVNPEANFGHAAGVNGLLRFAIAMRLLERGITTRCANVRQPHPGLGQVTLTPEKFSFAEQKALIVNAGAGGDATIATVGVI